MSKRSAAFLATRLLASAEGAGETGLIVIVSGEHRAEALGRLLTEMAPDRLCRTLPAWDCLPYDRASPSPEIMGQRMAAIGDLKAAGGPCILVTTPEAALQRLPADPAVLEPFRLAVGQHIDADALEAALVRLGYTHRAEVDDVGHFALRGEVIDLFPAGPKPYRIGVEDGAAQTIHTYDPVSQRRGKATVRSIAVCPVSELVQPDGIEAAAWFPGAEHWLPLFQPKLGTVFDLLPKAAVTVDPEASGRAELLIGQIADAHRARIEADGRAPPSGRAALAPDRLYMSAGEWRKALKRHQRAFPEDEPGASVPRFTHDDKPGRAFRTFISRSREEGQRIVLAAQGPKALAAMVRQAEHATGEEPADIARWTDVETAPAGALLSMRLSADRGFVDTEAGTTLVAAADLLGHRLVSARHAAPAAWHGVDGEFTFDDAVIHLDHGMGVLRALETLDDEGTAAMETARLDFAGGADLLAPVDDLHRVWRYSGSDDVALDRLRGEGWAKRREKIMASINETAQALVSLARQRDEVEAPKLTPPSAEYERFCDAFPFALTPDQAHAIEDVLSDFATGRVMDRLVVGDVGFGKTEVALRAAAAAVLAGRQVAVVAPTTVLARQHVQSFRKRFEAMGIRVGQLSRLVGSDEAAQTRAALADGSLRVVVGTHALAGKDVAFKELGLLIVDEEQRFGTADKARLRALGSSVHRLTLSATPIPRTLQSALVGLQELSLITTAPARRRPIRTLVSPLDTATIRMALMLEEARGGQSFIVVPRIEDLETFADSLKALTPELTVVVAHGRLGADETDAVMVGFAEGCGDVLLATSIIESGLDVPRANTMIVVDADRFGLAQLHQLRGRVGRGRQQGICYLMTDPDRELGEVAQRRLETLATYDRLGSGMAISAQDLDARGAGDLLGDEQAGHLKQIGVGLYQHLLAIAVRQARGEAAEDWTPAIHSDGEGGAIPADYVPEDVLRLNLYARLARVVDAHDLDELAEELEDRFGPLPPPVQALLARARLRTLCRAHDVERVDIGPKAVAFTMRPGVDLDDVATHAPHRDRSGLAVKNGRLVAAHALGDPQARLHLASRLLGDMH